MGPWSQKPATESYSELVNFTTLFSEIYFNNILPPTPWSSKWSLSLRFTEVIFYTFIGSLMLDACLSHLIQKNIYILIPGFKYVYYKFTLKIEVASTSECS
jgi:hypothetical protein